jgi:low temperature requirement protein LtrA
MTDVRRFLPRLKTSREGDRVTTFELLFDLVFVFAFTQVTEFMAVSHSGIGVLQAMIILGFLWWSWASYSWLANQTHVDEGIVRIGMSVAMVAVFVLALAIPESFDDHPGGLEAPWPAVLVGIAYLVIRLVHGSLYLVAAGEDGALARQVLRTGITMVLGIGLLFAGALIGGPAQTWLWLGAIAADSILTYVTSSGGDWRINSAAHWAERHGLIVILALGESIVAIGTGAAHEALSVAILVGAVLGVILALLLWWLYFDITAIAAERVLSRAQGVQRTQLASDAYTYIHLVLIAGIVISALGVEQVLGNAATAHPLGLFGAAALFGGTSLYLAAHAAFWRRVGGGIKVWRLAGGVLLLALVPVGALAQPLVALGIVVAVVLAVVVLETRRYSGIRAQLRSE